MSWQAQGAQSALVDLQAELACLTFITHNISASISSAHEVAVISSAVSNTVMLIACCRILFRIPIPPDTRRAVPVADPPIIAK